MDSKENAEKHYQYIEKICHLMYVDAFIHGYKHGYVDCNKGYEK